MTWRRSAVGLALLSILSLGGCGDAGPQSADVDGGRVLSPVKTIPRAESREPSHPPPPAPPAVPPPDRRARSLPSPGHLTVQITRPVRLRAAPGGPVVGGILPKTEFRSDTIVPVVRQKNGWLGVISTELPNGRVGWIAANTGLVTYRTRWSVVASLGRREVVVRRSGRVMQRFRVAIGSPSTPTPTGRFAVTDKLLTEDPASVYGCCILALSARQPHTPQGWGGGDRVAIHATNLPETIGMAASLGCLRAPAEEARRLVRTVPLGTIVTIRA
jgi:lipoprotein-anchoring transpeptidase ErfK/SrfK